MRVDGKEIKTIDGWNEYVAKKVEEKAKEVKEKAKK